MHPGLATHPVLSAFPCGGGALKRLLFMMKHGVTCLSPGTALVGHDLPMLFYQSMSYMTFAGMLLAPR